MNKWVKDVREFMSAAGQDLPDLVPWASISDELKTFRGKLVIEETSELLEALEYKDKAEIAKEAIDVLVVTIGLMESLGIDSDACWDAVASSNKTKIGSNGLVQYNSDGKVLKGPNYKKPDMEAVCDKQECSSCRGTNYSEDGIEGCAYCDGGSGAGC